MTKPKLSNSRPTPPKLTEEIREDIIKRGNSWSEHYAKKAKDIKTITMEDWKFIVK